MLTGVGGAADGEAGAELGAAASLAGGGVEPPPRLLTMTTAAITATTTTPAVTEGDLLAALGAVVAPPPAALELALGRFPALLVVDTAERPPVPDGRSGRSGPAYVAGMSARSVARRSRPEATPQLNDRRLSGRHVVAPGAGFRLAGC